MTEFSQGGELLDKIIENGENNEQKVAETIKLILEAINYCHRAKIVFRDLKPEYILLDTSK